MSPIFFKIILVSILTKFGASINVPIREIGLSSFEFLFTGGKRSNVFQVLMFVNFRLSERYQGAGEAFQ